MGIALHLPDDVIAHLQAEPHDLSRHVLESLALAWYQSGELNEEQLRRLLGYRTRLQVHAFLADRGVPLPILWTIWNRIEQRMIVWASNADRC